MLITKLNNHTSLFSEINKKEQCPKTSKRKTKGDENTRVIGRKRFLFTRFKKKKKRM